MFTRFAYMPLFIWFFSLLLSSCAGVDQKRALDLANSPSMTPPPVSDINRSITNRSIPRLASPGLAESREYEIGPEDLLKVTLFNIDAEEDGLPREIQVRVSHRGSVTLPLLGNIQVGGLTPVQLEQTLQEEYGEFMYGPEVGVMIVEYRSQSIPVLGAVGRPGVVTITGPRRLLDVLALAGGVTQEAGMFVHVSRQGAEGEQVHVVNIRDLASDARGELNLPIRSGDVINVPHVGEFFVDGYVRQPGAYPLVRPYTLTQALAMAGGVDSGSKSSDVRIFRHGPEGGVQVLKYDLGEIQALEAEDVQIAQNDVIVVPPDTVKMFVWNILESVGISARASQSFTWRLDQRWNGGGGRGWR